MKDEALKLAKAWFERNTYGDEAVEVYEAIEQALAAPVQEPVACVQDLDEVKRKHLVYEKGMDWKDPLYTTPTSAQPAMPLTDEEIEKACVPLGAAMLSFKEVARAIEAKLKEKQCKS